MLLIPDIRGWAIENKARQIARHLQGEFRVRCRPQAEVEETDLAWADVIVVFFWMQLSTLVHLSDALERDAHKLALGVCSHKELEGSRRQDAIRHLNDHGRVLFANNFRMQGQVAALVDKPIFYTPNGVDIDFYSPSGVQLRRQQMRVGWAGSLTNMGREHRGFDDLIVPSVRACDEVEFVPAIREERWRSAEEMREYYRALDVYMCASQSEGTPNGALEAAASGVPVISTAVGCMPEFITDGDNGFLVRPEVDEFVARLEFLRDNPQLRTEMGIRARTSSIPWAWADLASRYVPVFEAILGQVSLERPLDRP